MKTSYSEITYSIYEQQGDRVLGSPNYATVIKADDPETADYIAQALNIYLFPILARFESPPYIILAFGSECHPDRFFNEISV